MKLRCEVTEVKNTGDAIRIAWQGSASTDAEWRPMLTGVMEIPATVKAQRAYHVGRVFTMELSAQ